MTDQEINEAVARKLGHSIEYQGQLCGIKGSWSQQEIARPLPNYCNDIKAAWEIVVYLLEGTHLFNLDIKKNNTSRWYVRFTDELQLGEIIDVVADTAPKAICLAFLKLEDKNL